MSSDDFMSRWLDKDEAPGYEDMSKNSRSSITVDTEAPEEIQDMAREGEVSMLDLKSYRSLVIDDPAYRLFLANVRRECILAPPGPNLIEMVRNEIFSHLPLSRKFSKYQSADPYQMTFLVEWDPRAFLVNQKYPEKPEDAIERAITVTGSVTDAQALTCCQYLCQTWPSTGMEVLQLIKDIVRFPWSEDSYQDSCKSRAADNFCHVLIRSQTI
jgi:hypothetical protein